MKASIKEITAGTVAVLSNSRHQPGQVRQNIEANFFIKCYVGDRRLVINLLNDALETELVCILRYIRHFFMAKGMDSDRVKVEFLTHAREEMIHTEMLAKRIVELGGDPDFSSNGLNTCGHIEYPEGDTLKSMVKENLIAARIAIETYCEVIEYLAENDPATTRVLSAILAVEEQHVEDLAALLQGLKTCKR